MVRRILVPAGVLTAACAAFVAVRTFTLLRSPSPYTAEVTEFGLFAEHLTRGLIGPPGAYMPLVREGGTLLYGLLCAPLFAAAGPSFLTLRMSGVLWHAAMLAVFGVLAWRLARWRGVVLLAALWTLAPPSVVKLQQMGWASHMETALLGGLALLALVQAVDARRRWPAAAWALGAGAAAGLAPFFTYSGAGMAAGVGIAALWARPWRRGWPLCVALGAGFVVGVAPIFVSRWLWYDPQQYWALSGGDPVTFLLGGFESSRAPDGGGFLWRFGRLTFHRLPEVLGFHQSPAELLPQGRLYLTAVGALLAVGLSFRPRHAGEADDTGQAPRTESVILVGAGAAVLLHLAACAATDFDVVSLHDRYVLPLFPFLALLASGGGRVGWIRGGLKHNWRLGLLAPAAVVLIYLGAAELANTSPPVPAAEAESRIRGYRFTDPLRQHLAGLPAGELADHAEGRPLDRFEILRTHGEARSVHNLGLGPQAWSEAMTTEADAMPAAGQPALWEGIGRGVATGEALDGGVAAAVRTLPADDPAVPSLLFGVGDGFRDIRSPLYLPFLEEADAALAPGRFAQVCAGVGARLMHHRYGLQEHLGPGRAGIPGCREEWLAVGVAMQLAREALPDARWPPGQPELGWYHPARTPHRSETAFRCAFEAERQRQAAIASASWATAELPDDPLITCLVDTPVK